jgi:hypothetical protein
MTARILFFISLSFTLFGCATSHVRTVESPDLKLSFVIDAPYDTSNILEFFRNPDPAGLESRAASMDIDVAVARKIRDASLPEARNLAKKIIEDRLSDRRVALEASQEDIDTKWKNLLPLFSRVVVQETESPWVHPAYTCVLSSVLVGSSSWYGNKVAIKFDGSPELKGRILAHELLLSDIFQLFRRRYAASQISDWQVWAFSEVTPVLILDDPRLQPYWPTYPHAGEYFGRSNYPQLAGLEKQLKEIFEHRINYTDYEEKAVPLLRAFQPSFPAGSSVQNG